MPTCYLLSFCNSSSLDQRDNSFSMFHLIEEFQFNLKNNPPLLKTPAGELLPVSCEVHVYWQLAPEEINRHFEMQLLCYDANGKEWITVDPISFQSNTSRYHLVVSSFVVVPKSGDYKARLKWRVQGQTSWKIEPISWPFTISLAS
jgi:hypothetical protein